MGLKRPNLSVDASLGKDDALAAVLPGKVYFGSIDAAFNLEGLQAKGITHIINTSGKAVDMYTGVQYCNFALRDREGADVLAVVAQTNELIAAVLRAEGRVLVNCWAGRSRSAAIAVGFLMAKHGRSYDDAVEQLRAQRPAVKINIGFERQLRAFGASNCQLPSTWLPSPRDKEDITADPRRRASFSISRPPLSCLSHARAGKQLPDELCWFDEPSRKQRRLCLATTPSKQHEPLE